MPPVRASVWNSATSNVPTHGLAARTYAASATAPATPAAAAARTPGAQNAASERYGAGAAGAIGVLERIGRGNATRAESRRDLNPALRPRPPPRPREAAGRAARRTRGRAGAR